MKQKLRIGTRKSPLALKQVDLVMAALGIEAEVVPIVTSGDKFLDDKLQDVGGKGLFTKEIDEALLAEEVDFTVHSAKDMPTDLPDNIHLAAVLPREDARDVLISTHGYTLDTLPEGATVGTASLRRKVQLLAKRPDLNITLMRGNVQTRLGKIEQGDCDATLLALAGLKRLNIKPLPGIILELDEMLPAVCQGIVGITCRTDDKRTASLLAAINHVPTMIATKHERTLLRALDGNCRTPIGGYAEVAGEQVTLTGMLGDEVSGDCFFDTITGAAGDKNLGNKLAQTLGAIRLGQ